MRRWTSPRIRYGIIAANPYKKPFMAEGFESSYFSDFPIDKAVFDTIKNMNINITKEYARSHKVILFAIDKGAITKNANTAAAVE